MGKSFPLVLAVTLILCFSLSQAAHVSAQTDDKVGFWFMDFWRLQVLGDAINEENYTMRKGIHFGVCRMDETTGNPELRISFRPKNESLILQIMDMEKIDDVYVTGWKTFTKEDNCFGGGIEYGIQRDGASPMIVRRSVDRIFFDSRGMQRCTIDVTPLIQLNRLEVEYEIGPTENADIRVLSTHGELSKSDNMVRFYVDNPTKGATHSFTLAIEITPKRKQISYKPGVWVNADTMRRKDDPLIQGKTMEYETDYGYVIAEARDDVLFHPSEQERFGFWMQGISTTAQLIIPGVGGSSGVMGIELTNEMLMTILVVVLVIILVVAAEFIYRKFKSHPKAKSTGEQLHDLENEERKLRGMKKNVQREYFKGLITSQAFNKMTMEYEEKLMGIISKKDDLKKKSGLKR